MTRTAVPLRALLALAIVLLPLLLAGATLPHTHDGPGVGLYNQEHDLVLMGALGSVAPLPVPVVAVVLAVVAVLSAPGTVVLDRSTCRLALSRAPPTA